MTVLRHVSILTDHRQGVGLYLVKFTELFKKTLNLNPENQSRCCVSNTCSRCTCWPLWCCALHVLVFVNYWTTVVVELKSYSEIKDINNIKKLGVWSREEVMVSNWVHSCLATWLVLVITKHHGPTVQPIHCDTTENQCYQTGIY